jgi:16S rRNA (guanine(966)-N(2))-methyltransferase RsmD
MRVIAGSLKGRRLAAPDWPGLRPTSDKLRETLFNVLGPRVAGARVLDLYAGTGAVGLEALSRGALAVTFVERDPRAVTLIGENLARCGASEGCAIIRGPVARGLATLGAGPAPATFDVIFLDPPYETPVDADLTAVGALAAPGAVVVVEHARRHAPPVSAGRLRQVRQIRSGDSMLSFYTLGE